MDEGNAHVAPGNAHIFLGNACVDEGNARVAVGNARIDETNGPGKSPYGNMGAGNARVDVANGDAFSERDQVRAMEQSVLSPLGDMGELHGVVESVDRRKGTSRKGAKNAKTLSASLLAPWRNAAGIGRR